MWAKRFLAISALAVLALAATNVSADPGDEPEFCTVTVMEVARHLVLETDQFQAVFDNVACKKGYHKSFRVQVAGEPYYARGVPRTRDPGGYVNIPPILLSSFCRRGRQASVGFKYEDEILLQMPAGGTTVVIGERQFDITGKKRTLFVDATGRVRESDLVLEARIGASEFTEGRIKASDDASSVQEDKYDEDYQSTSSELRFVDWMVGGYRGNLAMGFVELRSVRAPGYAITRSGNETGRGFTVVFEGYPWSSTHAFGDCLRLVGDPAPIGGPAPGRLDNSNEIAYSYARQASSSFPKHVATIRVNRGTYGYWVMRITEGGKRLQVGENVIDLTGPKKHILFKQDGSIEIGDEPILEEKRGDK